jgi:ABC-type nitrate/sulfonate/bicarbonate transport system substrate-binding protein
VSRRSGLRIHPVRPAFVFLGALAIALGACAGGATQLPSGSSPASSVTGTPPTGSAEAGGGASGSLGPKSGSLGATPRPPTATVRLALDWTPNTDHTGFYVAEARGWYAAGAIDLKVLPYTGATPESIVSAGQAECGISFEDSLTFAVAAGAKLTSVMAILQHNAQEIAVLASSGIGRPRDLDGTLYAGFGYPNEVPTLQAVIRADGGTGAFKVATLNGAAYEALYQKKADFVITFAAWEGLEAKERGIDLRYFPFTDYGFPDFYQVVLACNRDWLAANPDVARRFVAASVRGFEFAQSDPDAAAADLVAQNPGVFDANAKLPLESARFLAGNGYYVDANGQVGRQTLETWTAYPRFLYEHHLLTGPDGKPLSSSPDYGALFTDDFLP